MNDNDNDGQRHDAVDSPNTADFSAENGATIRDAEFMDNTGYTLSIDEVSLQFQEAGVPRDKRSLQRYCESGHLDCRKYPTETGSTWYINPDSVRTRIDTILQIQEAALRRHATTHDDMSPVSSHEQSATEEPTDNDRQRPRHHDRERTTVSHQSLSDEKNSDHERQATTGNDRDTTTESNVVTSSEKLVEALVSQLEEKDRQIKRRDDLITNINQARSDDLTKHIALLTKFAGKLDPTFLELEAGTGDEEREPPKPATKVNPIADEKLDLRNPDTQEELFTQQSVHDDQPLQNEEVHTTTEQTHVTDVE